MTFKKIFPYTFLAVILALFFYSFTQVDLALTLSRSSIFQAIERNFQYVGYFNRPLSNALYLIILTALSLYFIYFLNLARRKEINIRTVAIITSALGLVLTFSYVAFSYDIFNYIFDAKIITFYHQNPYLHKALDYPGDPMLSFMRWTHRVYPYGPMWLVLTVPFSYLGHNIFLVTFFLFKFISTVFYFGSAYLIYKINRKLNPGAEVFNTIFFALSPLVIIELLVSSHNDGAMIFFALLGIYFYLVKNKILGIIFVIISAAVKIPTAVLLLPLLIGLLPFKKYKMTNERLTWSFVFLSIIGLLYAMTKLEIQPWYFVWILPFAALLKPNKYVVCLTIGTSIGLLLRYTVLLYYGNWDGILILVRNILTVIPVLISILIAFVWSRKKGYNLF